MSTKRPASVFRQYTGYLRPHWGRLALAAVLLLGSVAMHLARPWPLKVIFDYVLIPSHSGAQYSFLSGLDASAILLAACGAIILLALAYSYLDYFSTMLAAQVGQKIVCSIREELYRQIQRLSMGFHSKSKAGDLLSRLIRDVNQLRDFLSDSVIQLASETAFLFGMVAVMLIMDWQLALLSFCLYPLLIYWIARISGEIGHTTRKRLDKESKVASMFSETLIAIREVQLFVGRRDDQRRFDEENLHSYKAEMKTLRSKNRLLRLAEVVGAVGMCLVLWFGTRRVLAGGLTAGDLLVFITYLKSIQKPLRRIASLAVQGSKTAASADRVMEILSAEADIKDEPGAVPAPVFRGDVEFRDVQFAYGGQRNTLVGVSFRVHPGQIVAIAGSSGAGKTTLISLIARLYDPTSGAVLFDGVDARRYTIASLRAQIAVVPQDPVLVGATIRENIAFGDSSASIEDIVRSARMAGADEFIERFPLGYDAVVGERGTTLSGGQRRRIAIARALLRDTPIVILDEATTGLDEETELKVLRELKSVLRDKTVFLIAHRLSSVLDIDLVVMMKGGRVVEAGTPDQLLRDSAEFRDLAQEGLHAG